MFKIEWVVIYDRDVRPARLPRRGTLSFPPSLSLSLTQSSIALGRGGDR